MVRTVQALSRRRFPSVRGPGTIREPGSETQKRGHCRGQIEQSHSPFSPDSLIKMGLHNQVADMAKIYVLVLPFWSWPKHSFLYTFAGLPSLLALGLTHLHAENLLSNRDFDRTHRTRRSKIGQ
jgi:hypothetical protein